MERKLFFALDFKKKMFIISNVVGLIISLSMPLTYFWLSVGHLLEDAGVNSRHLAAKLGKTIEDNEALWLYNTQKFAQIFSEFENKNVISISVYNNEKVLVKKEELARTWFPGVKGISPVKHNNKVYGYIEVVQNSQLVVITTMMMFGGFFALGITIGLLLFYYPTRIVRRAERGALDAFMKLKHITYSLGEGVFVTDQDGLLTFINPAAERLMGWSAEELLGQPVHKYILPQGVSAAEGRVRLGDTSLGIHEDSFVCRDGRTLPVSFISTPINEGTSPTGWVTVFHDITEQKQHEAQLEAARLSAEAAKASAEAANRSKDSFLANMSHEIRTPMNGILGMTELALATNLSSEQREYLELVKVSANSLLSVINEILDIAKLEAGKTELHIVQFSLYRTIKEAVDSIAITAQEKGLELIVVMDPDLPDNLAGDAGRLRQVLINLLGNAIKFSDQGEVGLWIKPNENKPGKCVLEFNVTDTGKGIPRDKMSLLFSDFSQLDASITRKYGGTGLGLAICKRLVELMGGTIRVESQEGLGSAFSFTAEFALPAITSSGDLKPADRFSGLNALVVDDNHTSRIQLGQLLSGLGMNVFLAGEGVTGLSQLTADGVDLEQIDVALIDSTMPDINGLDLIREIHADRGTRLATVLMMIYHDLKNEQIKEWLQRNPGAHILKPVLSEDLVKAMTNALAIALPRVQQKASLPMTRDPAKRESNSQGRDDTILSPAQNKVLLVEDNLINQKLVSALLRKKGFDVMVAPEGSGALELLETDDFDLVLLDIQLAEVDGYTVAAQIRANKNGRNAEVPIIALTAYATGDIKEMCRQAGMNDYLSKPIDPNELFSAVEKATQRPKPNE